MHCTWMNIRSYSAITGNKTLFHLFEINVTMYDVLHILKIQCVMRLIAWMHSTAMNIVFENFDIIALLIYIPLYARYIRVMLNLDQFLIIKIMIIFLNTKKKTLPYKIERIFCYIFFLPTIALSDQYCG